MEYISFALSIGKDQTSVVVPRDAQTPNKSEKHRQTHQMRQVEIGAGSLFM